MKIIEKIRRLLRREPLTEEELEARAEAAALRAQRAADSGEIVTRTHRPG